MIGNNFARGVNIPPHIILLSLEILSFLFAFSQIEYSIRLILGSYFILCLASACLHLMLLFYFNALGLFELLSMYFG